MEIHGIALYDHREGVVQSGASGAPIHCSLFENKLCIICAILLWKNFLKINFITIK